MTFKITETKTPNGYTKIVIYHDDKRKVIIDRSQVNAHAQRDYYVNMITGVTQYTQWLSSKRGN